MLSVYIPRFVFVLWVVSLKFPFVGLACNNPCLFLSLPALRRPCPTAERGGPECWQRAEQRAEA